MQKPNEEEGKRRGVSREKKRREGEEGNRRKVAKVAGVGEPSAILNRQMEEQRARDGWGQKASPAVIQEVRDGRGKRKTLGRSQGIVKRRRCRTAKRKSKPTFGA